MCWAPTEEEGRASVHRLWANSLLSGQLAQILPRPRDFEAASEPITEEAVGEKFVCGPDTKRHIQAVETYVEAGYDEVYISQIGSHFEEFFRVWEHDVAPALR